jgi:hypothetical protein
VIAATRLKIAISPMRWVMPKFSGRAPIPQRATNVFAPARRIGEI